MKVLLVNPPWKLDPHSVYSKTGAIYPPLGLASMAAVMTEQALEVEILDAWGLGMGLEQFARELAGRKPDVVGLTAYTVTLGHALAAADTVKRELPAAVVVLGGPHPTIMPNETLLHPSVDFVVRGEGEFAMLELLRRLGDGPTGWSAVAGLSWLDGDTVRSAEGSGFVPDLRELPWPDRERLPMEIYRPASGAYRRLPVSSMITSRGCPFACGFCSKAIFGSTVRLRTAEQVVDEMAHLQRRYGTREIYFADDCFTVNRARAMEICERIHASGMDMTWSCSTRVNLVSPPLLAAMKRAGCISIGYGIETGDEAMALHVKKGISKDQARAAMSWTRSAGIETRTSYIFGFPGEDRAGMQRTLDFALELDSDFVIFNLAIPLPGTELFREADERGLLLARPPALYGLADGAHVSIQPQGQTPDELQAFYRRAYRRYYLRPRYVLKRLAKIRSAQDVKMHLQGFMEFLNWNRSGGG